MRHPLHPIFVHVPIALLGTSFGFDAAALVMNDPIFWTIAFWNIAVGCSVSILTVVTGLIDSRVIPEKSDAQPPLTRHLLVMLGGLSAYGSSLVARGGPGVPIGYAMVATLVLEGVGLGLLAFGGWLGGELVYRHGVGRAR